MNPEETVQPVEEIEATENTEVVEETQPVEPTEVTEVQTEVDTTQIELLQSINDSIFWSISLQVVIVCLLLFTLFFNALKAGRS